MKTIIEKPGLFICLAIITLAITANKLNAQPEGSITFQTFYDNLSPYGQWINDPVYGYVWAPEVETDFRPYYTRGHWVMTEYGNMWVSDYPWGWATYHYGRWTYDNYYGWVWIPDTEWAPAWVTWRSNADYYGWAPLGPGISIGMSFGSYNPPDNWWVFISPLYIYHPQWHKFYYGHMRNREILHRTTIIYNTCSFNRHVYIIGPRAEEVRRVSHRDVTIYKIHNEYRPGNIVVHNNYVNVYRPAIAKSRRAEMPQKTRRAEHPIGQAHFDNEKNKNAEQPNRYSTGQQTRGREYYQRDAHNQNSYRRERQQDNRQPQQQRNEETQQQPAREQERQTAPNQNNNTREKQQNNWQPQQQKNNEEQQRRVEPARQNTPNQNTNINERQQQSRQPQMQRRNDEVQQQPAREEERKNASNQNMREKKQENRQPQMNRRSSEAQQQSKEDNNTTSTEQNSGSKGRRR